jgi:beta-mannosidase
VVFAAANGRVSVVVINDTDLPWQSEMLVSRERLDGETLASQVVEVNIPQRTSRSIALAAEFCRPGEPSAEIVVARIEDLTRVHTFVEDIELALSPDPVDVTVKEVYDGYAVQVRARSLARDVTLLADQAVADATVDDALVTLTAGQSTTFLVRTSGRKLEQPLDRPPVLRTANDLQHT